MEITDFAVKIILLFIPGIIAFLIIESITVHKEIKIHRLIIYSLLLGFICYSIFNLIMIIIEHNVNYRCSFFISLTGNSAQSLNLIEIFYVTLISILVGFISSTLINYKILHKIAFTFKASKKFGDIDVWGYIMNSSNEDIEWVVVRDIENDLIYEGWVNAFSDGNDRDEMFLRYVIVFRNSTGVKLYEVPAMYLPRKRDKLIIEFPKLKMGDYNIRKKKDDKNDKGN
jgi:hypothetical protein